MRRQVTWVVRTIRQHADVAILCWKVTFTHVNFAPLDSVGMGPAGTCGQI